MAIATSILTKCPDCESDLAPTVISKTVQFQHDNKLHAIQIDELHVLACAGCGSVYHDAETSAQVESAVRAIRGLMTSEEMRALRGAWQLKLSDVSQDTGIAEGTLSKYENGHVIQSKVYDNMLRVYYNDPAGYRRAAAAVTRVSSPIPIGNYGGKASTVLLGSMAGAESHFVDLSAIMAAASNNYALAA